jgi:hypothetical protein
VSIAAKLAALAETGPVQIGVIGAGKFGPVFRAPPRRTPDLHVVGINHGYNRPAWRSRPSDEPGKPQVPNPSRDAPNGRDSLSRRRDRRRRRGHHSSTESLRHALARTGDRPASRGFGDLASTARPNLAAGETLDGEGGCSEVAGQGRSDGALGDCVVDHSTTPSGSVGRWSESSALLSALVSQRRILDAAVRG